MNSLFLTSPLLSVPHGFSTRQGGVSQGPLASLDLSTPAAGPEGDARRENFARLATATGMDLAQLFTVSQVHGIAVLWAKEKSRGPLENEADADALVTERADAWLGVRTADCVPILLQDRTGQRVAAVHSGWRGTEGRIVERAVEAMVAAGAMAQGLRAVVGPCIQVCCYEVSKELAEQFKSAFGPEVVREEQGGKPHLDLPRAISLSLLRAGVAAERQDVLTHCTACEPELFYSHRRDHGQTGRHLSFISPRVTRR